MAGTAEGLSNAVKSIYTKESFLDAFNMEIQGSLLDTQRAMNRQTSQRYAVPYTVTPNPFSYTERAARQRELMQRKKKPSYRQRQKNGRAGRK